MNERALPLAPDYHNACVTHLVPALLEGTEQPDWIPAEVLAADRVVLVVLDGLGWNQLEARTGVAPTLAAMDGGSITTVAPSTTAAALTSISTGRPPGEHGLLGYRIAVSGGVLNTLRWNTADGDARTRHDPAAIQPVDCFGSQRPPVVTWSAFADSGFTRAHLAGARLAGFNDRKGFVDNVVSLASAGEPFIYAYWDGIDHTAHEFGLADRYDSELAECDKMIADLAGRLPTGTAVMVTADHGQVHVGESMIDLPAEVTTLLAGQSGEARFRWLHARPGAAAELLVAAREAFGEVAWVRTANEVLDTGWLGPVVTEAARGRLGDVAVLASEGVGFVDPAEVMPFQLIGRHGSLTPEEMLVPALGAVV
jgi:hypothetical protein